MDDFEKIYREHRKTVYAFLMTLSGDAHLAEELTQETMFRAIMNYRNFRGEAKIAVWLCQIAKNLYYERYRTTKRHATLNEGIFPAGEFKDITLDLEDREMARQILEHLHILEEPYKEVFMLHALGDVSLKEIGRLFHKSDSWARVTYYRAKSMIIQKIKEDEA